jgi:hypothetical protein
MAETACGPGTTACSSSFPLVCLARGRTLAQLRERRGRAGGRPGGSTFTVQERGVVVIEWTGGLIVRVTDFDYNQIDEARAAAERLAKARADG